MSQNSPQEKAPIVDIGVLLPKMLTKWYIFVLVSIIMFAGSYIYTRFFITPTYDSTAKIFILNTDNPAVGQELSIASYLTRDYAELIVDRTVLEEVIQTLDLKNSYGGLKGAVSINTPLNTRIIEITVRTDDPVVSKQIVDCICTISQKKIVELMKIDQVNIISTGNLPGGPSSPNMRGNLTYSFIAGLILAFAIVTLILLHDDKIKRTEDIEEQLKIGVLGVIPYNKSRTAKH